ncbi:MAG TPA: beta-ketoacyl synthase N-terminal-like domain-containing protein [Verrucomicrobiae bacterium]|nr:beta-ketoacyl synthase N-terminal-like domain-containing protein [Verrucomicrobiae bacterium]
MSELEHWQGALAVTGIGLVTPVGLSAPASLAALRAGISRIGDLPGFSILNAAGEPQPITGAQVPRVPANRQGPARLARLAAQALREAAAQARLSRQQRCAVFLGAPAPHPGRRVLPFAPVLQAEIEAVLAGIAQPAGVRLIETGRAAGLQALRTAARELSAADSRLDAVLVGSVDSLISTLTLGSLQAQGRLREGPKSTGILPGEAAGFLVLERLETARRRGAPVAAILEAAAGATETVPLGKPTRAVVLGKVMRALAPQVTVPMPLVISDLNGERFRAFEWMFASSRTPYCHAGMRHWRPAQGIGDAGAGASAVSSAWAVVALARGYAGTTQALVWGASDEGAREAALFKQANGAI